MQMEVNSSSRASERLAKYEAWAERLEQVRQTYERRLPTYRRCLVFLAAAGFACFGFGGHVGLWGSISATLVSVAGYFMVRARLWELTAEIDATRREIDLLGPAGPVPVATRSVVARTGGDPLGG